MAKNQTVSSSDETDSFPEDLPSSEKQRHMNPVSFVQKAEELVMQQIMSNANFGNSSSQSKPQKKNKPVMKQRAEAMKKGYKQENRAVRKDKPLQEESLSEEYELIEEDEESESEESLPPPPPKKKKFKEFKI